MVMKPIFDLTQSFEHNYNHGPFFSGPLPDRIMPPPEQWVNFLGYNISSRIGVAACPLTAHINGVRLCSALGFDIITIKTMRSHAHPPHPFPNVAYINCPNILTRADLHKKFTQTKKPPSSLDHLAITNSIGNTSFDIKTMMNTITQSRTHIKPGQILIASVFGSDNKKRNWIDDFSYTAACAQNAGAHIIEANLSCPNIKDGSKIFENPDQVFNVVKQLVHTLKDTPLIIKVGLFSDIDTMKKVLCAAARAGARGISGINAVGMQIINAHAKPFFGENRKISGVSGAPIRNLALQFIHNAVTINKEQKLNLTLIGIGGITLPDHFDLFLKNGADVALSTTGAMWNPYLATHYHNKDFFNGQTSNHTINVTRSFNDKKHTNRYI